MISINETTKIELKLTSEGLAFYNVWFNDKVCISYSPEQMKEIFSDFPKFCLCN